jgi:PAS domain S-box-containing protein
VALEIFRPDYFDTRSILLSISGLFFGLIPTAIAVLMTAIFRIWQGGGGVYMGVATIFTSSVLGLAWRKSLQSKDAKPSWKQLYVFGIIVHIVLLICTILLPKEAAFHVFKTISLPIMLIYPIGTVLVGTVLVRKKKRRLLEDKLAESEIHYRTLANTGQALVWTSGTDKKCDYFNQPWLDFTGRTIEQELGDGWIEGVHPDDLQRCVSIYTEAFDKREKFSMQYRLRHASGEYLWIQDDGTPRFNGKGDFIGYIGHCLDVNEQRKKEATQSVLYEISNATHSAKDLQELFKEIHHLLSKLIDTTNFYIALYEEDTNMISSPYFIDEIDKIPPEPQKLKEGLTSYIIKTRTPQLITPEIREQMIKKGDIPDKDWKAKMWLGVPLITKSQKIIGAIAVQSYINDKAYSDNELQIMKFVSTQIAQAIEYKSVNEEIMLKSLVLDQIQDLVTITDLNGVISYVNQAEIETMGFSYEEILGNTPKIYGEDTELGASQQEILEKTLNHGTWRGEVVNISKDGSKHTMDCRTQIIYDSLGKEIAICGISTDITDRIKMEKVIAESEEKFRTTLQSIGDAVITTDRHSKILYMNPVAEKLTGWDREEVIGCELSEIFKIINESTREKVEIPTEKVLREGIVVGLANHTLLITKQGDEIPIADSGAPIRNNDNEIIGVVLVFRDQTKERTARRKLERSEAALQYAQELANMGSFELDLANDVLRWSENNYRLMGYEPFEIKPTYELFISKVHPDDKNMVLATTAEMKKDKKPLRYEFRVIINGKIKWLQNDVIPIFKNDEMIALKGVDIDITQRKMMEERIHRINETLLNLTPDYQTNVNLLTTLFGDLVGAACALYNRLDESMLCSYGQWNTPPEFKSQDKPDGHICYDVIQKCKNEILLVRDLQHSDYYETDPNVAQYQLQSYFGKAVKCYDQYVGSLCAVFIDDFVPTKEDEQLLGIIVAAIQAEEERNLANKNLEKERRQLLSIFDSIDEGIYIADTETYEILFANKSLRETFNKPLIGGICYQELQGLDAPCPFCTNDVIKKQFPEPHKWEFYNPKVDKYFMLHDRIIQWSDGRKVRLELAINITERKLAENILRKRLKIEQIVSKLSTNLINIKSEVLDKEIEKAMEKIGTYSEVDRVYIFQYEKDRKFISNTYEWCSGGVKSVKENLQVVPVSITPWWMQKLENHETIHIPNVAALPDEAKQEKELLEMQQIQSVLVIPLVSNHQLYGFMGFDSVKKQKTWDNDDVLLLHLMGEIFINAILRVESNLALKESEERYEAFMNAHKDMIFVKDENMKYLVVNDELAKFFGKPKQEILHHSDFDLMEENFAENCKISDKEALEKGDAIRVEETINNKIYEITKFSLPLKEGKIGVGGIIHDITARKEAEEKIHKTLQDKEILLQEVYHRTKNNMQVIRSMMRIQAAQEKNEAVTAFSQEIGQKILAMSLIHQKSYHSKDLSRIELGGYISELSRMTLSASPLLSRRILLDFDIEEVISHIESAMPFGLVMNELITHSIKHSFNQEEKGTIFFYLRRVSEGEIEVRYSDSGSAIASDCDFTLFSGLQNVVLLVENQLKGSVTFAFENDFPVQYVLRITCISRGNKAKSTAPTIFCSF